jgi:Transposase DDE domain
MFTDWLVEAYYLRLFLQLSKIPHYTTLQKFTDRINSMRLGKIVSSFILFTDIRHIFTGIDATGFKIIYASEYYTNRAKLSRKKYAKLSIGADVLKQIICKVKVRRAPTRHDNIDFAPTVIKISKIKPLSVVVADKAYDSEDNHELVREKLNAFSIIPSRYEKDVPVWKTKGRYRKEMKRGYNKILYNQRNKDETIVSVIKRLFGEHITSTLVRMQNRELIFRCIAYNIHRMVKLVVMMMVSTQP